MADKFVLAIISMCLFVSCNGDESYDLEGSGTEWDVSGDDANVTSRSFPETWIVYRQQGGINIDVFMTDVKLLSRSSIDASLEEITDAHFGGPYEASCSSGLICTTYPEFAFDPDRVGETVFEGSLTCDSRESSDKIVQIDCAVESEEALAVSVEYSRSRGVLSYVRTWDGQSQKYDLISERGLLSAPSLP